MDAANSDVETDPTPGNREAHRQTFRHIRHYSILTGKGIGCRRTCRTLFIWIGLLLGSLLLLMVLLLQTVAGNLHINQLDSLVCKQGGELWRSCSKRFANGGMLRRKYNTCLFVTKIQAHLHRAEMRWIELHVDLLLPATQHQPDALGDSIPPAPGTNWLGHARHFMSRCSGCSSMTRPLRSHLAQTGKTGGRRHDISPFFRRQRQLEGRRGGNSCRPAPRIQYNTSLGSWHRSCCKVPPSGQRLVCLVRTKSQHAIKATIRNRRLGYTSCWCSHLSRYYRSLLQLNHGSQHPARTIFSLRPSSLCSIDRHVTTNFSQHRLGLCSKQRQNSSIRIGKRGALFGPIVQLIISTFRAPGLTFGTLPGNLLGQCLAEIASSIVRPLGARRSRLVSSGPDGHNLGRRTKGHGHGTPRKYVTPHIKQV